MASILAGRALGVSLMFTGRVVPALRPERNLFLFIKGFLAGVILSTEFIHVLPDAFETLTSSFLPEKPWQNFPFTSLVAMVATNYYRKAHLNDDEHLAEHHGDVQVHTHAATHGHAHGAVPSPLLVSGEVDLTRRCVISQVVPWRESNLFFIIKAFAASVISCTGFIHVLPETFDTFTNPACRKNLMVSTFDGQGRAGEGLKSIGQDVEGVDGQDHPGCKGLNDEEEAALQP
nr:zinc transporter 8-like [Ipomoea batatas]